MAIPYFPTGYGYQNPYIPQPAQTQFGIPQTQAQSGPIIAWVQGEQAFKSFSLGPNQKAFLFNTEENNFAIKTTDANGMPNPLEIFAYHRVNQDNTQAPASPAIDTSSFVTREELDNRILELMIEIEGKGEKKSGK